MPGNADRRWLLIRDGRQHGPFTDESLRRLFRRGLLKKTDRLRRTQATAPPPAMPRTEGRLARLQARTQPLLDRASAFRRSVSPHIASFVRTAQAEAQRLIETAKPYLDSLTSKARTALRNSLDRLQAIEPIRIAGLRLTATHLAMAGGAVLVICGGLAATLLTRSAPLPPPAPSPIAWSFDRGQPLLVATYDESGASLIEAIVIAGENRSTQTLQKVEATLRSDRSNLSLQGVLQLADNPNPELLAFEVPPGGRFALRFSLPHGATPQSFAASHGGLTFTFRYAIDGTQRSLFQHIPDTVLEREIAVRR